MFKLTDLKVGEEAVISEIFDGISTEKLMELGCLPGEFINIENVAPMGDPIAVCVSGSKFSFRKSDAEMIAVKRVERQLA